MKLYSYVVARDYGFAPNPFFGWCTLATCKPKIRATAHIGDWIAGLASSRKGETPRLVYVMQVAEVLTYDDYWVDLRFMNKRPDLHCSVKRAFGDNIYHRSPKTKAWKQIDSHHSLHSGAPNPENIVHDTQSANVLIGTRFAYWGGSGPLVPNVFRDFSGYDIKVGVGHKCNFPPDFVNELVAWFESLGVQGCLGLPGKW